MTHDSEDEPMRGQAEMTGNRLSGYITEIAEDFLEAEAEVMRKTIGELKYEISRLALFEAQVPAQAGIIRRLADENAMLKSQLSELGLRIYGTDTPECPDQVLGVDFPQEKHTNEACCAWVHAPALATGPQGLPE